MTRVEAQHILLAYRTGTTDREDPDVVAALELVQTDPGLQTWLEEQGQFHQAVRDRMRSVVVPPDLRNQILAARKVVIPIWRRPEFLLAAACLGMAVILTVFWTREHTGR